MKSEHDYIHSKKTMEMMHTIFYDPSHTLIEIFGETHVAFFYPMPYFKLETLNKVFAEREKLADLSFHWISLKIIADPEFHQKYLTAFDLQIICKCA